MQVIESKPYGPGKFDTTFDQWLYEQSMDGDDGCAPDGDTCYTLLLFPDGVMIEGESEVYKGAILWEQSQGFVYSSLFTREKEARAAFERIEEEIYGEEEEEEEEEEDSEF